MTSRKTEITDQFHVRTEDGEVHMIVEMTDFIQTTSLDSANQEWAPSLKQYRIDTGSLAKRISPTEFQILGSGEVVEII